MAKKIISVFFCVLMIVSSVVTASATQSETNKELIDMADKGYESIAENEDYTLWANTKTGDFAVYDIKADHMWYSGQWEVLDKENPISQLNSGRIKTDLVSMVAVNYVQVSTIAATAAPSYQNSYAYCVIKDNVTVKKIKNGYLASYYFADIDSTIPVEITLNDSGIRARIPSKEMKLSGDYRITSIELLPGFMAADDRYEGYLFVPSGSGGIIPLASGKGDFATYSEMVYGEDAAIEVEEYEGETRNILVPVYGIKCSDSAIAAIITKGDSSAYISAEADSSTTSFSRIYSEYVTAVVDKTTLFESNFENQRIIYGAEERKKFDDYTVDYVFLRGENANYSGMASVYRERLNLKNEAAKPTLDITLYGGATKKASFLGIPYTKRIALTTFEQAKDIIKSFNEQDVNVSLRYIGWNDNGVENKKIPTGFSPMSVLGGKKGFKKLFNFIEDSDNNAFYDLDFISLRKSGRGFSLLSDVSRSIFNTRTPQYKYMRSVYVPVNTENPSYILKPASVVKASEKFFGKYKYKGGISFDKMGELLYSDFSKKGTVREETVKFFSDILEKNSTEYQISVDGGNAYTYPFVDRIHELPITNDGNLLFSESVPFVQMVIHGAISYSAPTGSDLLDCLEYGANISYSGIYADDKELIETSFNWLYGSTYTKWADKAAKDFALFEKAYKNVYNKTIVFHNVSNGISETVFDNGVKIYVNRTEKVANLDGTEIPANGYAVIGGSQK